MPVIRVGARAYVTKTVAENELATAIRQVSAGDAYFSGYVYDAFIELSFSHVDEETDDWLIADVK